MIESLIKREFTAIVIKAIERFAKQLNDSPENIQLSMGLKTAQEFRVNPNNHAEAIPAIQATEAQKDWLQAFTYENSYRLMQNFQPKQELKFKEDILNVRMDFKNLSGQVPPVIAKIVGDQAEKNGWQPEKTEIVNKKKGDSIIMYLYFNGQYQSILSMEELIQSVLVQQ